MSLGPSHWDWDDPKVDCQQDLKDGSCRILQKKRLMRRNLGEKITFSVHSVNSKLDIKKPFTST